MTLKEIEEVLDESIEELSIYEHDRWASWVLHVHKNLCEKGKNGSLVIPAHHVKRLENLCRTHYSDLSEENKEKDRKMVRPALEIIKKAFDANFDEKAEKSPMGLD